MAWRWLGFHLDRRERQRVEQGERETAAAWRRRDTAALQAALTLFQRDIYYYLCSICGDATRAQDLTQETFLHAWRAAERGPADGNLRAWFFSIARNVALDVFRTAARRQEKLAQVATPERIAAGDQLDEIIRREDRVALTKLLDQLSAADRELLHLRFSADFNCEAIATLTGANPAQIRKRISRLVIYLRNPLPA